MRAVLVFGAMLLSALGYGATHTGLREVRTVYVFPMAGSLDQYLVNALVKDGRFEVVTDPRRADAMFADRVGENFERKMEELFGEKKEEDETDRGRSGRVGGFSRSRGTVFLVDRESRTVLWSTWVSGQGTRPQDLETRAKHIVERLSKNVKQLEKHLPVAAPPVPRTEPTPVPVAEPSPAPPADPAPAPPPPAAPEKP